MGGRGLTSFVTTEMTKNFCRYIHDPRLAPKTGARTLRLRSGQALGHPPKSNDSSMFFTGRRKLTTRPSLPC